MPVHSEIKNEAWSNMRKNCDVTDDLYVYPSLDARGPPNDDEYDCTSQLLYWLKVFTLTGIEQLVGPVPSIYVIATSLYSCPTTRPWIVPHFRWPTTWLLQTFAI